MGLACLTTQAMVISTPRRSSSQKSGQHWATALSRILPLVGIVKIFLIQTLSNASASVIHQTSKWFEHVVCITFKSMCVHLCSAWMQSPNLKLCVKALGLALAFDDAKHMLDRAFRGMCLASQSCNVNKRA